MIASNQQFVIILYLLRTVMLIFNRKDAKIFWKSAITSKQSQREMLFSNKKNNVDPVKSISLYIFLKVVNLSAICNQTEWIMTEWEAHSTISQGMKLRQFSHSLDEAYSRKNETYIPFAFWRRSNDNQPIWEMLHGICRTLGYRTVRYERYKI